MRRFDSSESDEPDASPGVVAALLATFAVQSVRAEAARIVVADTPEAWAETSIEVAGIAGDALDVVVTLGVPVAGLELDGNLHIPTGDGPEPLRGDLRLQAGWPEHIEGVPDWLRSVLDARLTLGSEPGGVLRLEMAGKLEPRAPRALASKLDAAFQSDGSRVEGGFALAGAELEIKGSLQADESEQILHIDSLAGGRAAAEAIIEWLGVEFLQLSALESGRISAQDVTLKQAAEGSLQLASGSLSTGGVRASLSDRTLAADVELDAVVVPGGVVIRRLHGPPFELHGELRIEPDWSQFEMIARGDADLTPGLLDALGAPSVESVSGRVELDELRQVFPSTAARDAFPGLRGRIANGAIRFTEEGGGESLEKVDVEFTSRAAGLLIEGRADSLSLGRVSLSGLLRPETLGARRTHVGRSDGGPWHRLTGGLGGLSLLLQRWGPEGVEFQSRFPEGLDAATTLRLSRSEAPFLLGELALSYQADEVLGDVGILVELPHEVLRPLVPPELELGGGASLSLRREGSDFSLEADLAGLDLGTGGFVEKRAGEALIARIEGDVRARMPGSLDSSCSASAAGRVPLALRGGASGGVEARCRPRRLELPAHRRRRALRHASR